MVQDFIFGTVGSPISTTSKPGGSIGAILRLKELRLSALELGWVRSVRVTENTCADIKNSSLQTGIKISVHAPYYINLNASEEEWPKSRKRLMDAAYFGFLSGATDIIFHPGSYFGHAPEIVLPTALKRLSGCANELQINNILVNLRPETMGKSAMIESLEDTLYLSKNIKGVEPCLDFAHLHAKPGNGSMNTRKEWEVVLERYASELGPESLNKLHIHLSGIEYTTKGEKHHLPIQKSDLDLIALFEALHDFKCGGRILCESPILEEDALFMQKLWENNYSNQMGFL